MTRAEAIDVVTRLRKNGISAVALPVRDSKSRECVRDKDGAVVWTVTRKK